jgi:kynurenine formamidase
MPIARSIVLLLGSVALTSCTSKPAPNAAQPAACGLRLEGVRMVDLTHAFDERTIYWPTDTAGFRLITLHHGPTPGGYFYAANTFSAAEHGGTHLDAPIHFAEGKATADRIPLERLVGPLVVVDIAERAVRQPDTLLEVRDIDAFERAHGLIAARTIVLVRTGWSRHWPNKKAYLGDDTPGDASHLHFPGISAPAAEGLVARNVAGVGIDTASIDHGPSRDFMAHRVLMAADVPAFENLTGLEVLPARGALLLALPMKIGGGSGGPLRAIALVPTG